MNKKKLTGKLFEKKTDSNISRLKDAIAPAPVFIEEMKHMKMGENYVRSFLIIDWPTNPKGNFLSKLYRFKGNLTISTHLIPKASDEYIKQTSNSITELSTELNGKKYFKMRPERKLDLEQKLAAANTTLEKLMSGDNKNIFHVHMYLHLQSDSLENLDRDTKRLMVAVYKRGLRMVDAEANMLEVFKAILPTGENTLPEMTYRNFDSEAASSLMPFDESSLFHERGVIKGINLTDGSLVLVGQKWLPSHNEFVVGQTGMGKTFYLIKDMLRKWMQGDRIFVIDPEGQISNIVKKVGAQIIKISPSSKYRINPLEIRPNMDAFDLDAEDDEDAEVDLLFSKIVSLKVFFKLRKKNMNEVEMAQIEKALLSVYKKYKSDNAPDGIDFDTDFTKLESEDFPILEDLYKEIENNKEQYSELKNFWEILYVDVYGSNSRMFNGHTNVDLDNDFIVFNLKGLEEDTDSQAAAMYIALSFLWDEITKKSDQWTWFFVDEAHTMASPDNPRAMKFLYNVYKRIRKYNGGATVATQAVADYLSAIEGSRNYGQQIIGSSISQLILPLNDTDISDLKKNHILNLSEEEERIISKFRQGEGIYVVGNSRVHMKIDHTPAEMKLIDPEAYEKLYGNKERVVYVTS